MGGLELSGNWKLLQQSFKQNGSGSYEHNGDSQTLKRKATKELRVPIISKKARLNSRKAEQEASTARTLKSRRFTKMGLQISRPTTTEIIPDTAVSTTAEDATSGTAVHAGKYVSLDCEMVGTHDVTAFAIRATNQTTSISTRPEYSILARVSLVTYNLEPLYDAYVLPPPETTISDYRTPFSGITPWHLLPNNETTHPKHFEEVQKEVAALLEGRVLVGHALHNDLRILGLSHPKSRIRDTAHHPAFRALAAGAGRRRDGGTAQAYQPTILDGATNAAATGKGRTPSLKRLAQVVLGWEIQTDEKKGHSSAEDARAAMALFKQEKVAFELDAAKKFGKVASAPVVQKGTTSVRMSSGDDEGEEDDEILESEDDPGVDDEIREVPVERKKKPKKKKAKSRR